MDIKISRFFKAIAMMRNESKALLFLILQRYLLLKFGDFYTDPDKLMKINLESMIEYTHARSTTDLSALFIAVNASD